jgi:ubiquitin carboxyl-terminal hydrolase 9/13
VYNQVLDTSAYKQLPYEGLEGLQLGVRFPGQNLPLVGFTDDPFATPETRKRAALIKGPIVNLDQSMANDYDMKESLFTALKDIFESIAENESRIGVVSPSKLIEVLKRENELFRSSMHQDAHEFLNFLLNETIECVDRAEAANTGSDAKSMSSSASSSWVHDLFEGLLTSETKCLTCEYVSRRDEQFLDLSIDLERNTSITACLQQFSASEMLCERNKFHCDHCGGLQEAEKRMKVKKLPKILALHLKRFKFTEDMQRNVKLFHRVMYPKHFRLFNTTFDAEDPDKLYELCAVVVHIGGGPYHGHYVSIVKTEHAGWLLFDDEMVESVDANYVFNFFGDNKGMASAYVLFYQEVSPSQMEKENLYTNNAPDGHATPAEANGSSSSVNTDSHGSAYTHVPKHTPIIEGNEDYSPTSAIPIPRASSVSSASGLSSSGPPAGALSLSSESSLKSTELHRQRSGREDLGSISEGVASPVSAGGFKFRTTSFGRKYSKKRKDGEDLHATGAPAPAVVVSPPKSKGLSFSFKK